MIPGSMRHVIRCYPHSKCHVTSVSISSVYRRRRSRPFTRWTTAASMANAADPTVPTTTPRRERNDASEPHPTPIVPTRMSIVPGLTLSVGTAIGGFSLASAATSALVIPMSGIPFSILLGMAIHNRVGYSPEIYQPGIVFATKTVLQGGIICVAAKLSFWELVTTGTTGIPVVLASVGAGLVTIPRLGRWAGLPDEMSRLITAGTSICGVTAITALAPAIRAQPRDIAVAVANTVAFGTIGMLTYPYLFHALCSNSEQVGMCLGVAIHDTSQVLGSALLYRDTFGDEVAFKVAAVTKLIRNLGLVVAIPLLTYQHHAWSKVNIGSTDNASTNVSLQKDSTIAGLTTFTKYVPPFLVAFVGMTALRTCGDFVLYDLTLYAQTVDFIGNDVSKYALGTAMAGVGLSTSTASLQNVGWKPFAVGFAGALIVGGTGCTIALLTV